MTGTPRCLRSGDRLCELEKTGSSAAQVKQIGLKRPSRTEPKDDSGSRNPRGECGIVTSTGFKDKGLVVIVSGSEVFDPRFVEAGLLGRCRGAGLFAGVGNLNTVGDLYCDC